MFKRFLEPLIRTSLSDTRVVAIAGPRQSGKSTLAKVVGGKSATYVSLDEAAQFEAARNDPTGYIRRMRGLTIIDEIQRVPELMLAIKLQVDNEPVPGRFLITGSADFRTLPALQDSLAGRIEIFDLLPLSRDETSRRQSSFLSNLFSGDPPQVRTGLPATALPGLIAQGGYPEALARGGARSRDWLRAYARAVLEQDLSIVANFDRHRELSQLLTVLAHHCGNLINHTQIGSQFGIDRKTVERYLELLEQLFLLRRVRPWYSNELKRLGKTPKLHFLDSGLAMALRREKIGTLNTNRIALGPLAETFVFSELSKQASWSKDPPDIFHFRDNEGAEIDFILETWDRRVVAIEVKSGATVRAEAFAPMRKLANVIGNKFVCGIVLADTQMTLPFGDKFWSVPISALWDSPGK